MRIIAIAQQADLTDEESMADAIELISQQELSDRQVLYLSCVDREDPSQLYDALIHFGAIDEGLAEAQAQAAAAEEYWIEAARLHPEVFSAE